MFGSKKVSCGYCKKPVKAVNTMGLCPSCEQYIQPMVGRHFEIIQESYKIIMATNNIKTLESRKQVVIDNMQKINDYQKQGVKITREMVDYVKLAAKEIDERSALLYSREAAKKG